MPVDLRETIEQGFGNDLFRRAQKKYPILSRQDIDYKYNPQENNGFLEFWPADEPGTPEHPRPKDFKQGRIGIEVYDPKTTELDILGDFASHHLIYNDPTVSKTYDNFTNSLTDHQKNTLREQYEYATKNFNESRPYEKWQHHTGLPGMFRGYAFKQWDPEFNEKLYTQEQIQAFDLMMEYLSK